MSLQDMTWWPIKVLTVIELKTIILAKFKEFCCCSILSIDHSTMDELFGCWEMPSGKSTIQTYTLEIINNSQIPMFFPTNIFHLLSNKPRSMHNLKCQNLRGIDFSGNNSSQVSWRHFSRPDWNGYSQCSQKPLTNFYPHFGIVPLLDI
jgi:hypothetical protein